MILSSLLATFLAGAASAASPTTHTVVPHDYLWNLAKHYYQNPFRWKVIYAANTDKIKDPHWIYPGQVLVIPEIPGPEIGEVGARPVEANAAPVAPPPEAPAAPAPAPKPPEEHPELQEDLSRQMPSGMTASYPSMERFKAPVDWQQDGRIVGFEGREGLAASGDYIDADLGAAAAAGQRFVVLRKGAPQELDTDQKAIYLQRVGVVELKSQLKEQRYRFLIVQSVDSLQVGDMLKREAAP